MTDHLYEMETLIRFNLSDDPAEIYTPVRRVANSLIKGGLVPYREAEGGWFFHTDKHDIIIKPGERGIRLAGRKKPK